MNRQSEHRLQCPYCGEKITVLIDCSVPRQSYIEDCEICCRPISLDVTVEDDLVRVAASHENE